MRRILGVLGGMGPAATLQFLARLQAHTPAARDQDHLRVLVDINPQVPDRNDPAATPGPVLVQMARGLRDAGAQVLAIACNTAHRYVDLVAEASGLEVIDMIVGAVDAARERGVSAVGVLGTAWAVSIYGQRLVERGIAQVTLSKLRQAAFMLLLYRIKGGDTSAEVRQEMLSLVQALEADGAESVIAGCTEVPLVLASCEVKVPLIDAGDVLARRCVSICLVGMPAAEP